MRTVFLSAFTNSHLLGNMSKTPITNIEDKGATLQNNLNYTNTGWAVSGQNLLTGEVVYLSSSGWVTKLTSARVFDAEVDISPAIHSIRLRDKTVLFPDKLRVSRAVDGRLCPTHFREAFRATGPSNRFHGKQAEIDQVNHV
jgi:uncharacterized protein DUF2849